MSNNPEPIDWADVEQMRERPALRVVQDDTPEPEEGDDVKADRLPAHFWESTPVLRSVLQAAQARRASPDAVLHAVLARVAACLDSTVRVDTRSGPPVTLGWYAGLYGPSGTGKGKAEKTAKELAPFPGVDIAHIDFSTGQGVIAAYLEMQEVEDSATGDTVRRPVQVRDRGYALATEGSILETMARSREGGTLNGVLCKAWTSERQGTSNADMEKRRALEDESYVLSMSLGVQLDPAMGLLNMGAIGLPQRLAWAHAALDAESTPEERPAMPGRLTLTGPDGADIPLTEWVAGRHGLILEVPETAAEDIDRVILANALGRGADNPLDTHEPLWLSKAAALLALLHGWTSVTEEHWQMARVLWAASRGVRMSVERAARAEDSKKRDARRLEAVRTGAEVAAAEYAVTHGAHPVVVQTAESIARKVHRSGGEVSRKDAQRTAINTRRRREYGGTAADLMEEAVTYADDRGWIAVLSDGGTFSPGLSQPGK